MLEESHRFKLVHVILTKTNTTILGALSPTIGSADVWRGILRRRHQLVGVTIPVTPATSVEEDSLVGARVKTNVDYMPTVADAERNPSDGRHARRGRRPCTMRV